MCSLPDNIKTSMYTYSVFSQGSVDVLHQLVQLILLIIHFEFWLTISFIYLARLYNKYIQRSSQFYILSHTKIPLYDQNSSNVVEIRIG